MLLDIEGQMTLDLNDIMFVGPLQPYLRNSYSPEKTNVYTLVMKGGFTFTLSEDNTMHDHIPCFIRREDLVAKWKESLKLRMAEIKYNEVKQI